MALQLSTNFRGIVVKDAYHRIVGINASRDRNSNLIGIYIYPVKPTASSAAEPVDVKTVILPFDNTMTFASAYERIKALPEFAGALSV